MALVTLEKTLQYLKESEDRDDVVQAILDGVSAEFESRTNRVFAQANYTDALDGGCSYVLVENPPIISVTSVHESNSIPAVFNATTLVDADTYVSYAGEGRVQLLGARARFARGYQNVQVIYSGGWVTIPADVQLAVMRWVGHIWKEEDTARFGLQGRSFEGQQAQFVPPPEVPPQIMRVIRLYRRPSTG